jgi:hypothetical protein
MVSTSEAHGLLWVRRRHRRAIRRSLLYTLRTDILSTSRYVRFVPIAEVVGFSITSYIAQSLRGIVMPDDKPPASQSLPPHIQLIQMGRAHLVSRLVCAAAKLGLADQLASVPKSAAELAGAMQVHAPSLHRLMRTLASLGILAEQPEQRFALTSLGEALKTDAPARQDRP